jgi:putative hemolysin
MKYLVLALTLFSAACQSQNFQAQPQRQIGERRGAANSDWSYLRPCNLGTGCGTFAD